MIDMICHCGEPYQATNSNLRRGWGISCGKPCAGKVRMLQQPAGTRADGEPIVIDRKALKKRKRTSQAASTRHMLKGVKN